MKRICISSSLRFKKIIKKTIEEFQKIGIEALFPNLDSGLDKDNLDMETMKKFIQDHFHAIDNSEALYILNPKGYIGTLVKIEIGYARGKEKPIYFSEKTNSLDLDSLPKGVIPTDSIKSFLEI